MPALPKSVPIRSVPLSQKDLNDLLDQLDDAEKKSTITTTRRAHPRQKCRNAVILVEVEQHGHMSSFALPLRNISAGGVSFLHRSMLHVGTPATITIPLANGRTFQRSGHILRSRHVGGMVYEIALQFDPPTAP